MRISDWSSDVCSSDLHVAGTDLPSAQILIRHAQSMLPAYMVPHSIVLHERLPRGPSGKLDRNALPPPTPQASAATPPEGATEQAIAQVWQSVLARGTISRHDDFFALRSEEHTSELQSLMRISYAVLCLKKKHND